LADLTAPAHSFWLARGERFHFHPVARRTISRWFGGTLVEGSSAFGSQIRKAKGSGRIIFRQYGKAHMALVEVQKPPNCSNSEP
jgi:hypothetical protein